MKEVIIKRFEKGDLIRGKKGNGYSISNDDMVRGVVTSADDNYMAIKGLEFKSGFKSDAEFSVRNDPDKFELLPKVNNTAKEDRVMLIRVIAKRGSNLVSASVNYNGDIYGAHAECDPRDEFDLREGAAIAIGRAFDLIDEIEGAL